MTNDSEHGSVNPRSIRGEDIVRIAQETMGALQAMIDATWTKHGSTASNAELAMAVAVAIGVVRNVLHDALNTVQIAAVEGLISQFQIHPVPVDEA